jgi:hypothetical protein
MSESWHIGRIDQKTESGIHAVRHCEPKGLLKAAPRSEGRFLPCLGLILGLRAARFNADSRRWTEIFGARAQCKPPSLWGRSRNIFWLTTTLFIGLLANLCCPDSVACDVAKDVCPPRHRVILECESPRRASAGSSPQPAACLRLPRAPPELCRHHRVLFSLPSPNSPQRSSHYAQTSIEAPPASVSSLFSLRHDHSVGGGPPSSRSRYWKRCQILVSESS